MLEVVKQQESGPVGEERREALQGIMPALLLQSERMGDGRGDESRITERSEIDEGGDVEAVGCGSRNRQAQAGLANAPRPEQCQQADIGVVEQRESGRLFSFAADKWRRRNGKASKRAADGIRGESCLGVGKRLRNRREE